MGGTSHKGCHLVRYLGIWGLKGSTHWMIPKDEAWKATIRIFGDDVEVLLTNQYSIFRFLTCLSPEWAAGPTRLRSEAPLFHSSVKVIQDPIGLSRLVGCNGGRILQATPGHRTLFLVLNISDPV